MNNLISSDAHQCMTLLPGAYHALLVQVVRQLLAGLAYIHAQGIIHRDLKPGKQLHTVSFGLYLFVSKMTCLTSHSDVVVIYLGLGMRISRSCIMYGKQLQCFSHFI